jgi:hypothetical protein
MKPHVEQVHFKKTGIRFDVGLIQAFLLRFILKNQSRSERLRHAVLHLVFERQIV